MNNIKIAHRDAKTWQDKFAMRLMRFARYWMDKATGYTEASGRVDENGVLHKPKGWFVMDERKWLVRIVFLESIAGVPGMVGGMLRHLRSLRRLKRDNGWYISRTQFRKSLLFEPELIAKLQDRDSPRRSLQRAYAPPHLSQTRRAGLVYEDGNHRCAGCVLQRHVFFISPLPAHLPPLCRLPRGRSRVHVLAHHQGDRRWESAQMARP